MNNYREERCIGRGSYGCAYLVTEISSGNKFVVKKIPIELMTDKEKHQAFAEVELLSKLSNPFVVQYKENFVEGTVLHIVMGYCDGGDLTARIKEQTHGYFPTSLVMDWFVQMTLAIKYLHQRHILHRDLKTSNIFLTSKDVVKLGDFGIARTLDSTMDHAKTVVGTPYYMSPEVCESKPYSYSSDIWALGCVLYEVCALKHAFDAPNILMLIVKIIQHDFPPIPSCYPSELTTLLQSLLNKDPEKRPTIDQVLTTPFIKAHIDELRASDGNFGEFLTVATRSAQITPVDNYDYDSTETFEDVCDDVIRQPTPPARGGWTDGNDEVEEAIEACFDKEELFDPNYQSAYTEECSDSIHIDYGRKPVRRKALTIDNRMNKLRIVHVMGKAQIIDNERSNLPPLHPSTKPPIKASKAIRKKKLQNQSPATSNDSSPTMMLMVQDTFRDLGDSFVSNLDSDNEGPYTSMSDCEAEENFYSDDSDFDGHLDEDDFDFDDHVADHAYSDDFEDTEAEVIEYDNEYFSSDSDTSSSSSPVKDQSILLQSYSYDDDFISSNGETISKQLSIPSSFPAKS